MMIEQTREEAEKIVPGQVKPEKIRPASVDIELRDGRTFNVIGLSITTLKFMRRTDAEIEVTAEGEKFVVAAKQIRKMHPINPPPSNADKS